tara:strand:- start:490 stop:1500 length:1011 start_codon:yes stop_codon:yes gene_type:complete
VKENIYQILARNKGRGIVLKTIPEFPIKKPTYQEACEDFEQLCKSNITLSDGGWYSRSEMTGNQYIDIDKTGMKTSNYYHWGARMACDSVNSPSAMRSWYNHKFRSGLEASIYYKDNPASALALRKYIPSQFRPSAAKALINYFNVKSVYDPCGGWGDRLVAAQASGVEYYCRDVNPLVFSGYATQQQDFGGNVSFEFKGAEVDAPAENYFDMVFTSPPYFKMEKYQGAEQSHAKYKTFEEWVNYFLIPMLENSWESLKDNGILAINISNVYVNHTINDLTTPVINFIKNNCEEISCIGYRMNKRPNSSIAKQNGIFAEPIIVGKKIKKGGKQCTT